MKSFLSAVALLCLVFPSQARSENPLYLILGAVPQETKPIVAALKDPVEGECSGLAYTRGRLGENEVVVSLTGVGKSYTAMVTAVFLKEFEPDAAFMTGTAARIDAGLRTGDVILPARVFLHDYGSLGDDGITMAGLQPPSVPNRAPLLANDFSIPAVMHRKAMSLISEYEPHSVTVDGETYPVSIRSGVVTSGDFFGVNARRISELRTLDVDLMEMESATFALVCGHFGVPFLVVRSGSNQAQPTPSDDYLTYGPFAAESAAKATIYLVSNWK
ncbi:5'-methylthioadenosine/S-adenosylhomocysteine nucleosidase [Pelagicoccus sp. SDUM812003]|uniref:5'-methylthioadenosine/S-adenosylhomocysteine nucleosidase family protein n=1 Tax=Pelagicoccus sp. SDUM812003 TaxID=3041267 RepID=UPI00280FFB24|nr:5'-methylthioadenosine/S-adenosylhomocysteine nucleosidase [Pelagicoccus sp. SDUM812003]MDQ8205457.1 5'-methylthioadenosine/S-adenosylhomocysteine nucleosidase [Pelagicoccus sp. SDUM812003]